MAAWSKLESSGKSTGRSATQEIPNILCKPKFHYRIQRTLRWFLSWERSILAIPPHPIPLRSILILFSHRYLGLRSGRFFSFSQKYSPIHVTYPAQLILLDLVILIIFGKRSYGVPRWKVVVAMYHKLRQPWNPSVKITCPPDNAETG
jgi:hypothetical protein